MNVKFIQILTICSITVSLFSCGEEKKIESVVINDTIPVKVIPVISEQVSTIIETSGLFTTEDETILSFKTGGIVENVFVKEGDAIKSGQLIATLNMTEIKAQVQQAKIAVEKAKRDNMRAENLFRDSVATLEQLQNSKTALDIAEQQMKTAQFNERFSEIRANKNGFILKKFINEGQVIAPGSPAFQINGASNQQWLLKVAVSDRDWASISKKDKATIIAGETEIAATVSRKSESADQVTGSMWLIIEPIEKINLSIASGTFGKAKIMPSASTKAWLVPYDAILDGNAGEGYVFIAREDNTAEKIKISIGDIVNGNVLITGGLDSIKSIITTGNAYLNDKSPIKIIK
jgi:RND family efflux transporter MFP subunit